MHQNGNNYDVICTTWVLPRLFLLQNQSINLPLSNVLVWTHAGLVWKLKTHQNGIVDACVFIFGSVRNLLTIIYNYWIMHVDANGFSMTTKTHTFENTLVWKGRHPVLFTIDALHISDFFTWCISVYFCKL